MTFKVLFVCSANVCRSPSAALLLSKSLLAAHAFADVTVSSVGTDAVSGQARCAYCLRHIDAAQPELAGLRDGRARGAVPKRVGVADLILCADRDAVAKILRANPRVRPRVFTMIEGSILADRAVAVASGGVDEMPSDPSGVPHGVLAQDRLRWLVTEMDACRGQIPLTEQGRGARLLRRGPMDPIEIPDVHSRGERAHKKMLREVTRVTGSLSKTMVAALRESGVPTAG